MPGVAVSRRLTGVACVGCHTNPPDKELNETGKKFKACGYKFC